MDKLNPKDRATDSAADSRSKDAPGPVRHSILVVDDEENFLILLHWFFTRNGYEVVTASNADEALTFLSRRSFQVALLDVKLGSVDGVNLLEEMTRRSPELKVIMLTAYPTVGSIKRALDKGAVRYLTKPVDLQQLAQTIQVLF